MTKKKPLNRKIKFALKRKSKIFKRSITKKKDLISKKFNTSIKGKKIDIRKSVKNFFDMCKFFSDRRKDGKMQGNRIDIVAQIVV